ncbi:hypothetical protein KSD_17520 [Ktedonobacter sp. SOSP1-85]|uniref:tetratricopeptide repeat protein n=1 Tax=Ktedonobacter sp. SOSP1-85 TaxID=2778367 RepID=UPI001916248C|nr:tetratricopeptide repeat protein [Ktedonobacter sp. SOSP1-85]GHO73981.1 hypothetical protein KSD_17520 [Ktedonobacter sp. SOSP1-85]
MTEPREEPPVGEQTALGSYIAQANNNSTASVNVYEDVRPRQVEQAVLAAAREQLAQLPLETPPASTRPPVAGCSRLPVFESNPFFVGRQADLQDIVQALKSKERATIVVSGMGGIGKTQLASEFIFRYGGYFAGGVFWLNFADAAGIPSEIAACRTALREELRLDLHTLPLEEQVRHILAAWQSDLPRLLVFDNCEEEALLAIWRPPLGGCRILVTSRRGTWARDLHVQQHPLSDLKRAESIELLGKYRPDLTMEECNAIAETIGDLPLALHLAGNYLEAYHESRLGSASAYLKALSTTQPLQHPSLQAEGNTYTTRHIQHVARTFALSYERLDANDPVDALAINLLAHSAYFAPGVAIPRELLRATVGPEEDDVLEDRSVRAFKRLAGLGLLETSQSTWEVSYRLHRLLASFIRLHPESNAPEMQATIERVVQAKANLLNNTGLPTLLQALEPHLRFVTNLALSREDTMAALLCNSLGVHIRDIGAYTEAVSYLERALVIRKQVQGEEHPDTALSYNNLASIYRDQGRYQEAEHLFQQALSIAERILGQEHPDTASNYNNLASIYRDQGRYQEAEHLFQQALSIREHTLGQEHPLIASSYNNLAGLYQAQGRFQEAEPLFLQALSIRERIWRQEHPDTAQSYNNLALLYHDQGRFQEAEPLFLQALSIRERILGQNHPDIATSCNNLAGLYKAQGRYQEAEPLFQQALSIREHILGQEHPLTASSYNNLAGLYKAQSRFQEAEPLFLQALSIRKRVLGQEHPLTASNYNNLAELYDNQGRYELARPLFLQALNIRKRVLGLDHPLTANSYNNLAVLYQTQGHFQEAEPFFLQALSICERILGQEHPHTAASYNNLAELYRTQGRFQEAEPLFLQALAICQRVLGEEHPTTRRIKKNYDVLRRQMQGEKSSS